MGKHRQQRVRQGAPAPAPTSAEAQEAQQPTISQRTEQEQLELAVDLFYQKMMDDPAMEPFFRHIDMARQRHKIANFMLYILGGSEAYTGRDIYTVHRRMVEEQGLRKCHFDLVLKHMTATLQELGATPELIATARDTIHATLPLFRFPQDSPGSAGEGSSGGSSSTGTDGISSTSHAVSITSHAASSTSGSTRAGASAGTSTSSEGAGAAATNPTIQPSPAGSSGGGSEAGGEWLHVRLQPLGGATAGVAVLLSPQPSLPASDTEAAGGTAVGAAAELPAAAMPSAATAPAAPAAAAAAPSHAAAGPRPASPAKPSPAAPARWPLLGPGFSRLRSLRSGVNQLLPQLSGQWHAGGGWQGPAGASLAVAALAAAAVAAHLAVWCAAPGPPRPR